MSGARLAAVLLVVFASGRLAEETYVPSAPQNLSAINITSKEIHLSWSPPTTFTSPAFRQAFTKPDTPTKQNPEHSDSPVTEQRPSDAGKIQNDGTSTDNVTPRKVEGMVADDGIVYEINGGIEKDPLLSSAMSEGIFRDRRELGRAPHRKSEIYSSIDRNEDSLMSRAMSEGIFRDRRDLGKATDKHRKSEINSSNDRSDKDSLLSRTMSEGIFRDRRDLGWVTHRHRKRRQENPTKAEFEDSTKPVEKTHEKFEVVKKSGPEKAKNRSDIAYVLYYEQGFPRSNLTAITGVPSSEEIKNMNIFLSEMRMADDLKATKNLTLLNSAGVVTDTVGFRLSGLKSLTPYKIWVRAFYIFDLKGVSSADLVQRLGPRSEPIFVLTDVTPPSAPLILNLTCDQPAGILYLQWRQPLFYENSLDQYVVTLRKLPEQQPRTRMTIPTNKNEIETSISVVVELWNSTQYEVIVYAVTVSVARPNALIHGSETKPEEVSSQLCHAHTEAMSPGGSVQPGRGASTLVLVTVAMSVLLVAMLLYLVACGCRSRVSKCITAAYSFLEEGGERGAHAPLKTYKKPAVVGCSPLRACSSGPAASDGAEPEGRTEAGVVERRPPRMSSAEHPAVPAQDFPRHVAALHADGDIGFSKEYEVVVARSAALAHTSHHSHRPENRHKNRYLNITAYDHSRVCVSSGGQCGAAGCAGGAEASPCDYVNANFIDGMLPKLDDHSKEYVRKKLARRSRPHSRQPSQKLSKPPPNLTEGIESAFLNIEFSGIVESEEQPRDSSSESEDEDDESEMVEIDLDGQRARVKLEWLVWRRRYIATQGPTPATLPSFWRMVWQHRAHTLVMITNLVERGRRKCDMYWPSGGRGSTAEFGGVHVTLLHEEVRATYTVRHMRVKYSGGSDMGSGNSVAGSSGEPETRTVVQYHYTVWPDHGTPAHPLAVLPFVKAASGEPHTVLVHCSAGVGRTGTYIVLDAQLNQLRLTNTASPLGFLCRARTQRNHLVQTEEQYVFVHDALLEHVRSGETAVEYARAGDYLCRLLAPISPEELHVLDLKTEQASEAPCENGDASSVASQSRSARDDASEAASERRDEVTENGDAASGESDKRLSESTSLKDLSNGVDVEETDGKPMVNGVAESDAVYDLAHNGGDTYSSKMQAYAAMSRLEKEELRRVNRAENYAILERMRSLAGRKQQVFGPPPVNLLEKQFQLITRCCAEPAATSRAAHNLEKNRNGGVVPSDTARVMLVPRPGVEGSEYVNASWVSGRRRLREFAVSQHPTAASVPDLWRLLWDHTAQLVLVLTDPSDPECEIFWPTEEEPEFFAANFKASFISKETYVAYRKCDRREPTPTPTPQEAEPPYRRQESTECSDDERLIPENNVSPSPEQNSAGYKFDKVELRLERLGSGSRDLAARKSIANGDLFASLTESRRSGPKSPRSPSKMSLKSFKLSSPTRFKFPDWGSRVGAGSPPDTAPPPPPVPPAATVEEEAEARRPCYMFEQVRIVPEGIPNDRIVEVTNVSVHSLQDDYQLTVKIMRCSGWLEGDTVRYTPGKPDDNPYIKDLRTANTDAEKEEALDRLTEPFRDSFALIEFVAGRQMEYKNGPVVVVDKYGDWRAMSFCTLSAACGGARAASAPPADYRDPADDSADVYCWAALSAHARSTLSPRARAHSHDALLAQYAALARYGRMLKPR